MLRLYAPSLRLSQTLLRGPALRYPPNSIAPEEPTGFLLLESGDAVLLESGDKVILEPT